MQEKKLSVFIDPLTDFGAKRLFGQERNFRSLIDFLNSMLKLEERIVTIEFINSEQLGELPDDRKSVFDIHCRDEEGNYIIIEIQRVKTEHFKDRSIYYSTYPIREQAEKGDWNFKLKKIYTVCILNFSFDDTHPDQIVHRVKLIEEETQIVFSDRLMYWYIEVPKFKKTETELITREDKWLYVLKNLSDFLDIPVSLSDDPVFKSFFMDAKTAHLTELELQAYYAEKKVEWDRYAQLETAKNDGKREGKLEGIELATKERNTTITTYLLQHTALTTEQIAAAVNVPVAFVEDIRLKIAK